ncbi:MAG: beta-lactamase protein [Gemmatimonadetes bacterium]|nr:beta-lactamase protein [Gemmatimonadota bacterium]
MTHLASYLALLFPVAMQAQGVSSALLPSPPAERCSAAPAGIGTASAWLERAAARVLPAQLDGKVLRLRATHDVPLWEQSDRPYEPYIPGAREVNRWYDPATGAQGQQGVARVPTPTQYPQQLASLTLSYAGRDTLLAPNPGLHPFDAASLLLNPWLVLAEWRAHAGDARVVQRCTYRDYPRIVLARGAERLYLSESDAVPVKLERTEPHYLFGQVKAEYLWSTWWVVRGGGSYPFASFRQFDGTTYERVGVASNSMSLVPRDSAPRLTLPDAPAMTDRIAIGVQEADTVRVDDRTFQLVTRAYTETVTLQRDTVFLLDATSGEQRGRQDSTWIAKLFPGRHPMVLVVTDLAWPHISSVRFWVARGATIVSHRTSEDFIRRVVARRFTLEPDALEKARASTRLSFRAVDDSVRLAGGDVVVHALRGNSTEGALAVWVAPSRYLWAGDYVQPDPASPYYVDVVRTARALGLSPLKLGAQHMPLTAWSAVESRVAP